MKNKIKRTAFVNSPTPEQKKAVFQAHPELLSFKAEKLLTYNADTAASESARNVFFQNRDTPNERPDDPVSHAGTRTTQ